MSFPTMSGDGVPGMLMREPQVCLGPTFALGQYSFFVSGSAFATPANVYQDAGLTTAFPNTGVVGADKFGRFPPIYLDGSIIYGVQLQDGSGNQIYAIDPYTPPLSTNGLSTNVTFGPQIAATGEVIIAAPAAGGSQITLKLTASAAGAVSLLVNSTLAGQSALVINTSATTGIRTATFAATNKPGTNSGTSLTTTVAPTGATYTGGNLTANFTGATSGLYAITLSTGQQITGVTFTNGSAAFTTPSTNITGTPTTALILGAAPAGWLPITCDGVQYYTPIWHGNNFSPYVANPGPVGEVINAISVTLNGDGSTTATGGTALPSNWYSPTTANIGSGFNIQITKTAGLSGLAFSIANTSTNISNAGLSITSNAAAVINGTYNIITNPGGVVVASGTIQLQGGNGVQQPTYNGTAVLNLAANGTATLNGVATSNYYLPTTGAIGSGLWINITRTSGTSGVNFSAAQGAFTNIAAGLSIGLTGTGSRTATGTYQISSNAGGTQIVGQGSITLSASGVLNTNYSGTAPMKFGGDGTATLNGVAQTNWYSPTTTNIGSTYWVDITRNSGTAGVNFATAQGSWTNITNSGLSITLSGTSGVVGTATATGTYALSTSSTGTPNLGGGTLTINVTGLTVLHVYTTGANATETIPAGTTSVAMEAWGGGGGGGAGGGTGGNVSGGGGAGAGAYSRVTMTAVALGGTGKTFKYTVGAGGIVGPPNPGGNTTVVAGTVTGFNTITANGGVQGNTGTSGAGGAGGAGGTATNTNAGAVNTAGAAGTAGTTSGSGKGGTGTTGNIAGDGSPYGSGGSGGFGSGNNGIAGSGGAVVFKYA